MKIGRILCVATVLSATAMVGQQAGTANAKCIGTYSVGTHYIYDAENTRNLECDGDDTYAGKVTSLLGVPVYARYESNNNWLFSGSSTTYKNYSYPDANGDSWIQLWYVAGGSAGIDYETDNNGF